MAAGLLAISAYTPARDRQGRLVPGARMDVYANRTTTRAAVYADAALTTPLTNPVLANASGQFPAVWADGGTTETPILYSLAYSASDGTTIGNPSTFDDVQPGVSLDLVDGASKLDRNGGNVGDDAPELRLALSLNEVSPLEYGAAGDGVADDRAAITAALASGRSVNLRGLTYRVGQKVVVPSGRRLVGPGTIKPSSAFTDPWVVEVSNGVNSSLSNFIVDGVDLGSTVTGGIRVNGSTGDLVVERVTVRNLRFTGIDISGGAGPFVHSRPRIEGCVVENVAWTGINLEGSEAGKVLDNRINRTGYNGIAIALECMGTIVKGNYITKATPPSNIYSGPGSLGGVEGGFLIYYDYTCDRTLIDGNICDGNRNANQDGIGVGEDQEEFGSAVIANNIVRNAGLFGIDPVGNCTVTGNYIEGARVQGIHVGLDTGGILRNVIISNNVIRNTGDASGAAGILIGDTLGPAMAVSNVKIANNVVIDDRATKFTDYGVIVVGEISESTIDSLSITGNDLSRVQIQSILMVGPGAPGTNFQCFDNRVIGVAPATNGRLGQGPVAWTPTATPGTGAFTTMTVNGSYERQGRRVVIRSRIVITNKGTAAGPITVTLPVPAQTNHFFALSGVAGNTSNVLYVLVSGNTMVITNSGGSTAIVDGADMTISGSYLTD